MIMVQSNDEYYEEVIDNIDHLDEDANVNDEMNKDVNDEMISNHSLLCWAETPPLLQTQLNHSDLFHRPDHGHDEDGHDENGHDEDDHDQHDEDVGSSGVEVGKEENFADN